MTLGALCTGTYLLAKADLLGGYRSTIHWENMASMREEFPGVIVSTELLCGVRRMSPKRWVDYSLMMPMVMLGVIKKTVCLSH